MIFKDAGANGAFIFDMRRLKELSIFGAAVILLGYGLWFKLQAIPVIQEEVKVLNVHDMDHDRIEAIILSRLDDINRNEEDTKRLLMQLIGRRK